MSVRFKPDTEGGRVRREQRQPPSLLTAVLEELERAGKPEEGGGGAGEEEAGREAEGGQLVEVELHCRFSAPAGAGGLKELAEKLEEVVVGILGSLGGQSRGLAGARRER